ncbi:hypothetical protein CPK_ORF00496 [Chlamydia pneumoniae LPCoLN]|nr:hypothetical protein CPK_ORF00496 [Chlamydia pneumoniae LPCoLN]
MYGFLELRVVLEKNYRIFAQSILKVVVSYWMTEGNREA